MKRLVILGITLALVMGLFCFSVNAENIVIQGESDTVTATYGSNDITIALRARKLRVINTGTAAAGYAGYTPVIVSVTIYNLGNQNCLVNNLKFRLTSESAEYRIAGFENISPDLFISDTAYDTTGYLSLKASNDYTYAGGFVVPANSNMTYVGIINVSANWITENQTWRTVDLSTATFYENMTTTIGDYTCDAEPVDLTIIENDLDDIVTALQGIDLDSSTYLPMIQSLVNACSYTGTVPANINTSPQTQSVSRSDFYNGLTVNVNRIIGRPVYSAIDYELDTTNDTSTVIGTIKYPFIFNVFTTNTSGKPLVSFYSNVFDNVLPSGGINNYHIESMISNLYSGISVSGRDILLYLTIGTGRSNRGIIPAGNTVTTITGYFEVSEGTSISVNNVDISRFSSVTITASNDYYPNSEYSILRDLYLAYSSVNGIDDLSDAASDASDQAATIHNQEASYYAQNQAAIEATGLSNYQFSGEQSNGIGAVSNDFTALWNALGSWNSVYIFSMTLTLALTILRHVPNRRKPKEKNSE